VHAIDHGPMLFGSDDAVFDMDLADDHHAIFARVNFPSDVTGKASAIGCDFARFQRATKGA